MADRPERASGSCPDTSIPTAQGGLVEDLRAVAAAAPFFRPVTRWGKEMSVRMTSAGRCGWVSDRRGYRYEARHPVGRALAADPGARPRALARGDRARRAHPTAAS